MTALAVLAAVLAGITSQASPAAAVTGTHTPVMTLTSTPSPSLPGESVTLKAVVGGSFGYGTGSVSFFDGASNLGTVALDANGTASLPTTAMTSTGERSITVQYTGDSNYAPTTPQARTHIVDATLSRKTWVGAGGNWSVASNWSPAAVPTTGDTLVFAGSSTADPRVNDLTGLTVEHLSFDLSASLTGNAFTLTGAISVNAIAAGVSNPLTLTDGLHTMEGTVTLWGVVSGPGGIKKTGPDALALRGANTYSGLTDITAGVLNMYSVTALGSAAAGTTVRDGGTLYPWTVNEQVSEPVSLAGSGAPGFGNGALSGMYVHLTGPVTLSGDTVELAVTATLLAGSVSGASTKIVKTNTGSLQFNAANTFNGIDVTEGSISVSPTGTLGTGPVTLWPTTGLSISSPAVGTKVVPNAIIAGEGTAFTAYGEGAIQLTGALTANGLLHLNVEPEGAVLDIVGVVAGAGALNKMGPGALLLGGTGPNTSTGAVTVSNGALLLDADNRIGDAAAVTVAAGKTFDMFGHSDTFGSLTSAGTVYLGYPDPEFGDDASLLNLNSLSLTGGTLGMVVGGGAAGSGHDQIKAASVAVAGTLELYGDVPFGTTIRIVDNTGAAAVSGQFAGLGEGATVQTDKGAAVISYTGGTGNDITLTRASARSGYWMIDANGKVYPFGDAKFYGDLSGLNLIDEIVDIEPTADYGGYWVLTSSGGVFAFGNAPFWGSPAGTLDEDEFATSISNDGYNNYWIFTDHGQVFDFADAGWYDDMSGIPLNGPVYGSVSTPSGMGYYMVASDGGIFAFGDAKFAGSMGGKPLIGPVVGLAPDPDNSGYWLVATDGGIFAFGAPFKGSMGGVPLNQPVIGMVAYGDGYLMVGADGGIFNFSSKPFKGSLGGNPPSVPVVAVAPLNES